MTGKSAPDRKDPGGSAARAFRGGPGQFGKVFNTGDTPPELSGATLDR